MKVFNKLVRESLTSIYPNIVDKYSRSTLAHMSKIHLETDLDDPNFNFVSKEIQFDNLINTLTKHPNERSALDINLIAKYLKQTELMQKLHKGTTSSSENSLDVLCNICASQMLVLSLKAGSFVCKMDDVAETFFILLKGTLGVLKPHEKGLMKMTGEEYLEYLQYLEKNNEKYLLNKTLKLNYPTYPISAISEFEIIQDSIFKMRFKNILLQESKGPDVVESLFKRYKRGYKEFNIDENEMNDIWKYKLQEFEGAEETKQQKASNDLDWINYLMRKIKITLNDENNFEKYSNFYLQNERMEVRIIHYEHFMYIYPGQTFGDIALDTDTKRRTASVRAEEDSLIAILPHEIYMQHIRSEKIKLKAKEIAFLHDNFFFEQIPLDIFEKRYFLTFAPHEYYRGHEIMKREDIPTDLLMIREGKVEVRLIGSIIDLHNLIKLLIDKLLSSHYYEEKKFRHLINSCELNELKVYLSDIELTRLKMKPKSEVDELYKERKFQLCILSSKEIIGLGEIFLGNMKYMCHVICITEKVKIYKLSLEKLMQMCNEEKGTLYSFVKRSTHRVISLIKRIQHVKRTIIDFISMKRKEDEKKLLLNETERVEKFPTINYKDCDNGSNNHSINNRHKIKNKNNKTQSNENLLMKTISPNENENVHVNLLLQSPDRDKKTKNNLKKTLTQTHENLQLDRIKSFISKFNSIQKVPAENLPISDRNNEAAAKRNSELFLTLKNIKGHPGHTVTGTIQGKDIRFSYVNLSCMETSQVSSRNISSISSNNVREWGQKFYPQSLKKIIGDKLPQGSPRSFREIPFVTKYKMMNQKHLKKWDQASNQNNLQSSIFSEFEYNLNKDKNKFSFTMIKNYYDKIKRRGYSLTHKNHKKVNSVY